jgi:predicted lipoprotein with Yx(FWY)xxD motif
VAIDNERKARMRSAADGDSNTARPGRRVPRSWHLIALAALLAGTLAATAPAASSAVTLGSAANQAVGKPVVLSTAGRTLYALSPETSKHLLCKSAECFRVWPPMTVKSSSVKLKAATGVQGHLGILKRSNGMLQVTLRGLPLYRFSGDSAKGQSHGQGIESFGGKWHAVTASSDEATSKATPPPVQPEMPSYSPPSYPASTPAAPSAPPTTTTPATTPPASPPPYEYPAY